MLTLPKCIMSDEPCYSDEFYVKLDLHRAASVIQSAYRTYTLRLKFQRLRSHELYRVRLSRMNVGFKVIGRLTSVDSSPGKGIHSMIVSDEIPITNSDVVWSCVASTASSNSNLRLVPDTSDVVSDPLPNHCKAKMSVISYSDVKTAEVPITSCPMGAAIKSYNYANDDYKNACGVDCNACRVPVCCLDLSDGSDTECSSEQGMHVTELDESSAVFESALEMDENDAISDSFNSGDDDESCDPWGALDMASRCSTLRAGESYSISCCNSNSNLYDSTEQQSNTLDVQIKATCSVADDQSAAFVQSVVSLSPKITQPLGRTCRVLCNIGEKPAVPIRRSSAGDRKGTAVGTAGCSSSINSDLYVGARNPIILKESGILRLTPQSSDTINSSMSSPVWNRKGFYSVGSAGSLASSSSSEASSRLSSISREDESSSGIGAEASTSRSASMIGSTTSEDDSSSVESGTLRRNQNMPTYQCTGSISRDSYIATPSPASQSLVLATAACHNHCATTITATNIRGQRVRVSDRQRKRIYRVGLNLFNTQPESGIEYLIRQRFIDHRPNAVARFLVSRKGLSKQMIGEYLGNLQNPFNMEVLLCFCQEIDLTGLQLDDALRKFQSYFRMPGEAQKIERLMEAFASRYCSCNSTEAARFCSPDTIFLLAFAVVMLNTDRHNKNIRPNRKMSVEDFIRNLRGVDAGQDIDENLVRGIYQRISESEFQPGSDHVAQVTKVEQMVVGKCPKLALPHRRLVCYCRLYEVPDINKRERLGAHQREMFLFNDLLLVTKISNKKNESMRYQFRHALVLGDMAVYLFDTPYCKYGIRLNSASDSRTLITLCSRNVHDREKFVEDLKESILEVQEMNDIVKDYLAAKTLDKAPAGLSVINTVASFSGGTRSSNRVSKDSGVLDIENASLNTTMEAACSTYPCSSLHFSSVFKSLPTSPASCVAANELRLRTNSGSSADSGKASTASGSMAAKHQLPEYDVVNTQSIECHRKTCH